MTISPDRRAPFVASVLGCTVHFRSTKPVNGLVKAVGVYAGAVDRT
ncbi:MAG TPA: hypothetical protein VGJ18_12405 [Gemmatimonadaceae bacterium]